MRDVAISNPVINSPYEEQPPLPRPTTGKIAVKVINHYGDEVMTVFAV